MPNYLDAHLQSSIQTDADLNARIMYLHLAVAVIIAVAEALQRCDVSVDTPAIPIPYFSISLSLA